MTRAWIASLVLPLALVSGCGDGGKDGAAAGEDATSVAEQIENQVDSVTEVVEITEDNDPNDLIGRPNGYDAAAVIYDERVDCDELGIECGASVEQWEDADAAQERSEYIQGVLEDVPMLGTEYHYLDGPFLLRVWGDLEPSDAEQYAAAFTGEGNGDVDPNASASASATDTSEPTEEDDGGELVDYGFGQSGEYAAAMAIVENTSDHGGQTVTVSVNFLDEAGEILATETQLESFAYAGQILAMHVFTDLPKRSKVASVEPTLLVEDEGTFDESDIELDPVNAASITQEYGSWEAAFPFDNPTGEPLQDLRVGVVCRDNAGDIIGGTSTYPDLVPPNGSIIIETNGLIVSGEPATCTAYPSPAGF
ncbi:hypothetical protein [Nocardioides sp. SR21]|uniref:hypothetical protein n=1 Tax=Nocardioides sp. SR21 TaxID=2919501 RepID=UPI001FAB2071|nr:hypothetical protein [Nocardioides sp. SR21]